MSNLERDKKTYWHKRHRDWVAFDRIELAVVPRYKTSGLSGDEWRTSVAIRFFFGGVQVDEEVYGNMDYALARLPSLVHDKTCPIPEAVIKREETKCDQPGCASDAVARFAIKRETSDRGEWLVKEEHASEHYRQFCKRHVQRGDCGREDADDNYTPLDDMTAADSTNLEESPSTVMVVDAAEFLKP